MVMRHNLCPSFPCDPYHWVPPAGISHIVCESSYVIEPQTVVHSSSLNTQKYYQATWCKKRVQAFQTVHVNAVSSKMKDEKSLKRYGESIEYVIHQKERNLFSICWNIISNSCFADQQMVAP